MFVVSCDLGRSLYSMPEPANESHDFTIPLRSEWKPRFREHDAVMRTLLAKTKSAIGLFTLKVFSYQGTVEIGDSEM